VILKVPRRTNRLKNSPSSRSIGRPQYASRLGSGQFLPQAGPDPPNWQRNSSDSHKLDQTVELQVNAAQISVADRTPD
jgi:hypothetical protein